jgi:hypothetical protein
MCHAKKAGNSRAIALRICGESTRSDFPGSIASRSRHGCCFDGSQADKTVDRAARAVAQRFRVGLFSSGRRWDAADSFVAAGARRSARGHRTS